MINSYGFRASDVWGYSLSADWTRRHFLNTSIAGVASPLLVTSIEAAGPTVQSINESERTMLKAIVDEIIPAGNGMPSASQVGGVAYIEKLIAQEPGMGHVLTECITTLSNKDFAHLPQPERVAALKNLEASNTASFALLRDSVYESYYINPQIWKLIGYELYPTDRTGPHMKPFDKSVIATVSQKPRYYREA